MVASKTATPRPLTALHKVLKEYTCHINAVFGYDRNSSLLHFLKVYDLQNRELYCMPVPIKTAPCPVDTSEVCINGMVLFVPYFLLREGNIGHTMNNGIHIISFEGEGILCKPFFQMAQHIVPWLMLNVRNTYLYLFCPILGLRYDVRTEKVAHVPLPYIYTNIISPPALVQSRYIVLLHTKNVSADFSIVVASYLDILDESAGWRNFEESIKNSEDFEIPSYGIGQQLFMAEGSNKSLLVFNKLHAVREVGIDFQDEGVIWEKSVGRKEFLRAAPTCHKGYVYFTQQRKPKLWCYSYLTKRSRVISEERSFRQFVIVQIGIRIFNQFM
eukprot:TRINITY_DN28448_c0_g1_i2.p1 TRINITY_DN28448_c0_g1~~TRINITY_DN28448_c0_g1_i2.p1  ORF type:complete len:329 (-),score=0.60 TRINITY_DN28448_c0_g1_i2:60-1046(-)